MKAERGAPSPWGKEALAPRGRVALPPTGGVAVEETNHRHLNHSHLDHRTTNAPPSVARWTSPEYGAGPSPGAKPEFSDDEASERDADEPTPLGITAQRTTAERNDRMAKSGTSGDGLAMRLKHSLLDKRVEGETNLLNLAQRINA